MSVAIITSIYGDHDKLFDQPKQSVDAEWICVTDHEIENETWDIVIEPRPTVSDRLASKYAKCLPWLYTDAEVIIWIDGAYRFQDSGGIQRLMEWAGDAPLSQFKHYSRNCVYDEAEVSKKLPKYSFQPIDAQMEFYRKNGYPENNGLFAGGVIVRNFSHDGDILRSIGTDWLLHQIRWTDQDQLSEMPIAWTYGLNINELPGNLLKNEGIVWLGHLKGENR